MQDEKILPITPFSFGFNIGFPGWNNIHVFHVKSSNSLKLTIAWTGVNEDGGQYPCIYDKCSSKSNRMENRIKVMRLIYEVD